jgi:hypothetical protein
MGSTISDDSFATTVGGMMQSKEVNISIDNDAETNGRPMFRRIRLPFSINLHRRLV